MSSNTFPLDDDRLTTIVSEACTKALDGASAYDHPSTSSWNSSIITNTLSALTAAVPANSYKFVVNSTIIQHSPTTPQSTVDGEAPPASVPRGMHAASGAFWNSERDGTWSYHYKGLERKLGFDVVVAVVWVGA